MSMQTVSLSQLVPSKANPRKAFDAKSLEGLAASIRTDGVLQNLVVKPVNGKGKRYAIITGERRYRALKLACPCRFPWTPTRSSRRSSRDCCCGRNPGVLRSNSLSSRTSRDSDPEVRQCAQSE